MGRSAHRPSRLHVLRYAIRSQIKIEVNNTVFSTKNKCYKSVCKEHRPINSFVANNNVINVVANYSTTCEINVR